MKCGLVLEGGARRCMFSAAVLDEFMEQNIKFPYVVGVSYGAQAALSYVSEQKGRSKAVMMPEKIKRSIWSSTIRKTAASELERVIYDYSYSEFPFDFHTYFHSDTICELTVTSCETGQAMYIQERENEKRLLDSLRASVAFPVLFPSIEVDGVECVDGSVSDSLPYERAFEMGCDKAVVVVTKSDGEMATDFRKSRALILRMYGKDYPQLVEVMMTRFDRYMAQQERMYELEKQGKILVVKPDRPYVWAFELSKDKLEEMYSSATAIAREKMDDIKRFIGEAE